MDDIVYYYWRRMMIYKIGCLSQVIIVILLIGSCSIHRAFWPSSEAKVDLPMCEAVARFQSWAGYLGSKPYRLVVETPKGRLSHELWTNWGPADNINFYRTKQDWLVTIGGGQSEVAIDVCNSAGPRFVPGTEAARSNGDDWDYLGVVSAGSSLVGPNVIEECIPLFGAGSIRSRKSHQVPHSCGYRMVLIRE